MKRLGSILFLLSVTIFLWSGPLMAGLKKFPWRVVKFGASKTAAAAGAVTKKAAKKTASTAAGVAAHETVRTAVK